MLVCIHGSGHTAASFGPQSEAFSALDAVRLPGHPVGSALTSVADYAGWVWDQITSRGYERCVVAGHSLGGAIAMELALNHSDDLSGLVLISTGARLRVSSEILSMIEHQWPHSIDTLVDNCLSESASPLLRERMRSWHMLVGQESTRCDYVACDRFDRINRLSEIRLPTLLVSGTKDRMTPLKYARFLEQYIDKSQLLVVDGVGHMPHLEQPEIVNDAIGGFLKRLDAGSLPS